MNETGTSTQLPEFTGRDHEHFYFVFDIVCTVLRFMLIVPICYGNALVLITVCQFRKLRTPTNVFITSLAISDLMIGVITIPAFTLVHHCHFGLEKQKYACLVSYVLSHGPTSVSMVTLFFIAWERYFSIHQPFWYERNFTMRIAAISCIGIWIYVWTIIPALAFSTDQWVNGMDDCNFSSVLSTGYIGTILVHMLTILVTTTVIYILIARTAWKHQKAIARQRMPSLASIGSGISSGVNQDSKFVENAKISRMLSCVLGIFYLCWVPYLLSVPFALTKSEGGADPIWLHVWEQISGIVVLCNSFMNPLVYARKNEDFRIAFRRVLKKKPEKSLWYASSRSLDTNLIAMNTLGRSISYSTNSLQTNRVTTEVKL